MSPSDEDLKKLLAQEYDLRLVVNRLRREVHRQPAPSDALWDELLAAEKKLDEVQQQRTAAQPQSGVVLDTESKEETKNLLGSKTTKLSAKVELGMAHVPTSTYHLFDQEETPLVTCHVENHDKQKIKRVRITSFIEGYSARAVTTCEMEPGSGKRQFNQLPTLFPDRVRGLNEMTRGTLNVLVEDLGGVREKDWNVVERHVTRPIWLLPRTAAPRAIRDLRTGEWKDMTRYWGAFVTPNAPSVMGFLREVTDCCEGPLDGYLSSRESVTAQVRAVFEALKKAGITYIHSGITSFPEEDTMNQRVRLPSETLKHKGANCVDGTVLFASLLEAITLSAAIVVFPTHAIVGWETWTRDHTKVKWDEKNDGWNYLDTTMIENSTFEKARTEAHEWVEKYGAGAKIWPLHELRSDSENRIIPME